jgi:putative metallohydrolase (TIGR04338 family)
MGTDDRVFEAENVVYMMGFPSRFVDGESAAQFLDHVLSTRWFANRWPAVLRRNLGLKQAKYSYAYADFGSNTIYLPLWALNDFTLLHEVAHFCSARERFQDHGPMFRAAHHALIGRFMSKDAAKCYRNACLAYGVGF